MRVHILEAGIRELGGKQDIAGQLDEAAEELKARVRIPRRHNRLKLSTRHGVGPRGAFAQVIMRGSGALAVEFGTRRSAPVAPLRRALGGMR